MTDENQIEVPPSFMALYIARGGHRLTEPMAQVRSRYELCEDMAQMLIEAASSAQFSTGKTQLQVLHEMRLALASEGSAVQAPEAAWVVSRIAELLGWQAPPAD